MDISRETSVSRAKDSQNENSWIPATPAKPVLAKTQPICTGNQETQPTEPYLLEFERFLELESEHLSSESSKDSEEQVAFWGSTNSDDGYRVFNREKEGAVTKSQFCDDNVRMYNELSIDERLNKMPFSDLLRLVDNESANVCGSSSSSSLVYSSLLDTGLSLGPGCLHSIAPQYGISSFDLNTPAKTTEAVFTGQNISQFAPLTPNVANLINELQNENGEMQMQEEKAQQKPKRKRHRPKVVREGQPKRARKPSTPKPVGTGETPPTTRRKYVRKKVPATTPVAEEKNGGTNDPKTVGCAEESCKRALNFECESQLRDESPCKPPTNFSSQKSCKRSLNFEFKSEAKVESSKLPPSFGSVSHISAEKTNQDPSPLTPKKTEEFLRCNLMDDAQNSTRGKCRIVFSNETHDKEASSVPKFIDLINTHSTRSPTDILQAHHMLPVYEDSSSGRIFGGDFAKTYKRRSKEGQSPATSASIMQGSLFSSMPVSMFSLDPRTNGESALVPYLYHMRYQGQNEATVYNMRCEAANQLVVYKREGTVVPFERPVKRRKPRPKVDLDEETSKVWNLLIQDINSEGVDGTADKAKWWEEERRVFRGRADSFIARMHLIQGDRRFSKWKGSVVDSVVGVFLTQNVSDHLSSSAFMSLAARFPLKSKTNNDLPKEEGMSVVIQEPDVSVQESNDSITWHEEKFISRSCDKSSATVQYAEYSEAKEVVNIIESSQNSADSSITQPTERMESSKPNNFGCSSSFVQLLEMAKMPMLNGVHNQVESMTISSNSNLNMNHDSRYSSNINEDKCASEESDLSAESTVQCNVQIMNDNPRSSEDKAGAKKSGKTGKEKENPFDWDSLRKQAEANGKRERTTSTMDSLDYEEIRCADVNVVADAIKERGMNNRLAERIKEFLNRLVTDHGSIDLEWLRDIPPDRAKDYLLSVRGLGLKSVECVRLLTLHHLAFPVDTNVGRIAVRLGWVPLQPLPESLQLHLLELYPVLESIQKYLWPRLCKLDQKTLYELHYQMITFGKVFCTKSRPNCNACPLRGECRHFASAFASARLALPAPGEEKDALTAVRSTVADQNPTEIMNQLQLPLPLPAQANLQLGLNSKIGNFAPIIEEPATPEPIIEEPASPEPIIQTQVLQSDIEDAFYEDPDEIPTIKLNLEEFSQNIQNYLEKNMELQEGEMSKALVALTPDAASIPVPKLKNVNQLRTEHQVYELPDSHPLLVELDKREPDDPCPYLLAIWTPGETAESIQPPEGTCSSQEFGKLCDEKTCFSCNNIRESNSLTVRGTILIPCRTANRGSFPLNGTYFQVNEVFADHESSLNPIDVPRAWIWNLPRRTVYFGTSIPTIFKGLSTEGVQYCFWRGFVCVRGFDRKTRAPRPLMARLHFPASKLAKARAKTSGNHNRNEPSMPGTRLKFPQMYEEQQQTEIEVARKKGDLVIGILGSIPDPQG